MPGGESPLPIPSRAQEQGPPQGFPMSLCLESHPENKDLGPADLPGFFHLRDSILQLNRGPLRGCSSQPPARGPNSCSSFSKAEGAVDGTSFSGDRGPVVPRSRGAIVQRGGVDRCDGPGTDPLLAEREPYTGASKEGSDLGRRMSGTEFSRMAPSSRDCRQAVNRSCWFDVTL